MMCKKTLDEYMDSDKTTPTTILNELNRAVKMHNFYPSGHPHFETALSLCVEHIKGFVTETQEIKYTISPKGFEYRSEQIGAESGEISELAKKFFLRKIKELSITWRVHEDEIKTLVEVLRMEPSELSERGGIERFFAEREIEGLLLNEMRYEDLKRLKAEMQQETNETDSIYLDPGLEDVAIDDSSGDEIVQPGEDAETTDVALHEMIEQIKSEKDFLKFNDLSVRIRERCSALVAINALSETIPALLVFLQISGPESTKPKDFIGIASTQLKAILRSEPLLRYIAGRAGAREEANRTEIQQCLLRAEDSVINILLDDAVQAPEAMVRRNIFNTLLLFKERLQPFIEERMQSNVWYEVRQVATLLGETGDAANIDLLKRIYTHDNVKVKKEALKSLARIPSTEAALLLSEVLNEEDESLVTQAIVSLGFLGDTSALEPISEIALRWEPFAKGHTMQQEAIKALGNIGSSDSIATLTHILMRKSWFGKHSNEKLRVLAAKSIGKIDDEAAKVSLKKAMKNSEGALYATCKRVLDQNDSKANV